MSPATSGRAPSAKECGWGKDLAQQAKEHGAAAALQTAVSDLHVFLHGLPSEALQPKAWGPREVLAHLVFWLETYATQVEAMLAGDPPPRPVGSYDQLNQAAVAASQSATLVDLRQRHLAASSRLGDFAASHNPDTLIFTLKEGSAHRRPLSWYMRAEARHIRQHLAKLQAQQQWDGAAAGQSLATAVSDFCTLITSLPPEALAAQAWGPREVLAHLVFWHERWARNIQEGLAERPFSGPFGTVQKLNALAVAEERNANVADLLKVFRAASEQLVHYGRTVDPQAIAIPLRLAHDRRTLDDVLAAATAHLREHSRELGEV